MPRQKGLKSIQLKTPFTSKTERIKALHSIKVLPTNAMPSKPTAKIMLITPEMAMIMLQCNVINRPANGAWINELVNSLIRGDYELSNDAISFDSNGNLSNGQHRLYGGVVSGVPFYAIVAVNIGYSLTMDCGRKRSVLDNLDTAKYNLPEDLKFAKIVSIARKCCTYMCKTNKVSNNEIIDFMLHYQDALLDFQTIAKDTIGTGWQKAALFMCYIGEPDPTVPYAKTPVKPTLNDCKEFFTVFKNDNSTNPIHNPIRAAKKTLSDLRCQNWSGDDGTKSESISAIQDAMNKFLNKTCDNYVELYTPCTLYKYDVDFLNYDINGNHMEQCKFKN